MGCFGVVERYEIRLPALRKGAMVWLCYENRGCYEMAETKESKLNGAVARPLYGAAVAGRWDRWPYESLTPGADHPDAFERLLTRIGDVRDRLALRAHRAAGAVAAADTMLDIIRKAFGPATSQWLAVEALRSVLAFEAEDHPARYAKAAAICETYEKSLRGDAAAADVCDLFMRTQLDQPADVDAMDTKEAQKQARIEAAISATGGKVQRAAPKSDVGEDAGRGRPKKHAGDADRQRAYRERQKSKDVTP
jgi:hypothetical protein